MDDQLRPMHLFYCNARFCTDC